MGMVFVSRTPVAAQRKCNRCNAMFRAVSAKSNVLRSTLCFGLAISSLFLRERKGREDGGSNERYVRHRHGGATWNMDSFSGIECERLRSASRARSILLLQGQPAI